jgi:Fe-S-cluster containining protein
MTNTAGLPEQDGHGVFCNYCPGFCCYRLPGSTLLITATDINRIARHFQISDGQVRRNYMENRNTFQVREDGSCIFLAHGKLSRRCSIHPARPAQCLAFPYGAPCPYLNREDLLAIIYPKVERSLGLAQSDTGKDKAC